MKMTVREIRDYSRRRYFNGELSHERHVEVLQRTKDLPLDSVIDFGKTCTCERDRVILTGRF